MGHGDPPGGLGLAGLEGDETGDRLVEVGRALISEHGADVLILGCAGMARFRSQAARALGVPVIDPSQAAVVQAVAAVRLAAAA